MSDWFIPALIFGQIGIISGAFAMGWSAHHPAVKIEYSSFTVPTNCELPNIQCDGPIKGTSEQKCHFFKKEGQ